MFGKIQNRRSGIREWAFFGSGIRENEKNRSGIRESTPPEGGLLKRTSIRVLAKLTPHAQNTPLLHERLHILQPFKL